MLKSKKNGITLIKLVIGIIYLIICTFIFLLLAGITVDFIFEKKISLTHKWLSNISVASIITGMAGGSGSWIFAKLDERKARKSPPSDEDQD